MQKRVNFGINLNNDICDTKKTWNLLNDLVSNGRSRKKKGFSEVRVGDSMIQNPTENAKHLFPISAQLVQYWTQKYHIVINHHNPTWGRVMLRHFMLVLFQVMKLN